MATNSDGTFGATSVGQVPTTTVSTTGTSRTLNTAEDFRIIHEAFEQINFNAFDFNTIKASLIEYLRLFYPEDFNDYIESSEIISIIESFAYVGELIAYRLDLNTHENFFTLAEKKESVLRLARLISFNASRRQSARGLVRIDAVSTTEEVRDSLNTQLRNRLIRFNDPNNPNWQEQFFTVMNLLLQDPIGDPQASETVDGTTFELHATKINSLDLGVAPYNITTSLKNLRMELVSSDLDDSGPKESVPNPDGDFRLLFVNDGLGLGSNGTGFAMFTVQGELVRNVFNFEQPIPNRGVELPQAGLNELDVNVIQVVEEATDEIIEIWRRVDNVAGRTLHFDPEEGRANYEALTLEDDRIEIRFGDASFGKIPVGPFNIWVRTSEADALVVPRTKVEDQEFSFTYQDIEGNDQTGTFRFSLINSLTNAVSSQDIEQIRNAAPGIFFTQDRMVNNRDYNEFLFQDPAVLKLKAVNRTFSGQTKFLDFQDPSGNFQNIKLFGDDLMLLLQESIQTNFFGAGEGGTESELITEVIEPIIKTDEVIEHLRVIQGVTSPRTLFRELVDVSSAFTYETNSTSSSAVSGGVNQVITVSSIANASAFVSTDASVGPYFTLDSPASAFYVWFNNTAASPANTDPNPAGRESIQVDVSGADGSATTAAAVASRIAVAVGATPAFNVPTPASAEVVINNDSPGAAPSVSNVGVSAVFVTTVTGVDTTASTLDYLFNFVAASAGGVTALDAIFELEGIRVPADLVAASGTTVLVVDASNVEVASSLFTTLGIPASPLATSMDMFSTTGSIAFDSAAFTPYPQKGHDQEKTEMQGRVDGRYFGTNGSVIGTFAADGLVRDTTNRNLYILEINIPASALFPTSGSGVSISSFEVNGIITGKTSSAIGTIESIYPVPLGSGLSASTIGQAAFIYATASATATASFDLSEDLRVTVGGADLTGSPGNTTVARLVGASSEIFTYQLQVGLGTSVGSCSIGRHTETSSNLVAATGATTNEPFGIGYDSLRDQYYTIPPQDLGDEGAPYSRTFARDDLGLNQDDSWIIRAQPVRTSGVTNWKVSKRVLQQVAQGISVDFFYQNERSLQNQDTGLIVEDCIAALKVNFDTKEIAAVGSNLIFPVVSQPVREVDNLTDLKKLVIKNLDSTQDGVSDNPREFDEIVDRLSPFFILGFDGRGNDLEEVPAQQQFARDAATVYGVEQHLFTFSDSGVLWQERENRWGQGAFLQELVDQTEVSSSGFEIAASPFLVNYTLPHPVVNQVILDQGGTAGPTVIIASSGVTDPSASPIATLSRIDSAGDAPGYLVGSAAGVSSSLNVIQIALTGSSGAVGGSDLSIQVIQQGVSTSTIKASTVSGSAKIQTLMMAEEADINPLGDIPFTLESWLKIDGGESTGVIVYDQLEDDPALDGGAGFRLALNASAVRFSVGGIDIFTSAVVIPVATASIIPDAGNGTVDVLDGDNFHHLAGVFTLGVTFDVTKNQSIVLQDIKEGDKLISVTTSSEGIIQSVETELSASGVIEASTGFFWLRDIVIEGSAEFGFIAGDELRVESLQNDFSFEPLVGSATTLTLSAKEAAKNYIRAYSDGFPGRPVAVGDRSTFGIGAAQVFRASVVAFGTFAITGSGTTAPFFTFDTPASAFYIWFDNTDASSNIDPAPPGREGITVALASATTATSVAGAIAIAVNLASSTILAVASGVSVEFTASNLGAADAPADGTVPTTFGFDVTTTGSSLTLAVDNFRMRNVSGSGASVTTADPLRGDAQMLIELQPVDDTSLPTAYADGISISREARFGAPFNPPGRVFPQTVFFRRTTVLDEFEPLIIDPAPQPLDLFSDQLGDPSDRLIREFIGRFPVDFLWSHFTPRRNLVDPSKTNIIDMFIHTNGYQRELEEWLARADPFEPQPNPPTSSDLRIAFRDLLEKAMLSDTVVLNPGIIKYLFGRKAAPELRAKFRAIKRTNSALSDDQLRQEILAVIVEFFDIELWDFGRTFFFTEMAALIHQRLPKDVQSVVLVPSSGDDRFGDLFQIVPGEDEILQSAATGDDIEVIDEITRENIRRVEP